ncbi:hypothetical protein HAX54_022695 [Datura stramonium]|uniref:Uncharacterized protein n=1 Tax=Datura stramonium TaxID=4076 RepID=A0ABS8UVI5_DATST|nr:hypothetical protein [Datura stramonium]
MVDISEHTIWRLPLGPTYEALQNTTDMNYKMHMATRIQDISKVRDEANPIAKGRLESSNLGDSLFMDLLEENTPRDIPTLMGEGSRIAAESSAIEVDTPTTSSIDRLKSHIAKSIDAVLIPVHEVIQILDGRIDGIEEQDNERLRDGQSIDFSRVFAQQAQDFGQTLPLYKPALAHCFRHLVHDDIIESDEEGAAERAHKRERKEMKEALQCFCEEMHTIREVKDSTSRPHESTEHTGDYDSEGES